MTYGGFTENALIMATPPIDAKGWLRNVVTEGFRAEHVNRCCLDKNPIYADCLALPHAIRWSNLRKRKSFWVILFLSCCQSIREGYKILEQP